MDVYLTGVYLIDVYFMDVYINISKSKKVLEKTSRSLTV